MLGILSLRLFRFDIFASTVSLRLFRFACFAFIVVASLSSYVLHKADGYEQQNSAYSNEHYILT